MAAADPHHSLAFVPSAWRLVAILAVGALALVACGGDGKGVRQSQASPQSPTTASEPSPGDRTDKSTSTQPRPPVDAPSTPTADPSPTARPTPTAGPPPTPAPPTVPDELELRLTKLVDINRPIDLSTRAGTDALYVATKGGTVVRLDIEGDTATVGDELIDIGSQIADGAETGLLGLAFSPAGDELYLSYSDRVGDTVIDRYPIRGDSVAIDERQLILSVPQPARNHNGGDIVFGPDNYLYVALGDGGGAGDPFATAQDTGSLLGSILRIDPSANPYSIPPDNPFAEQGGRPEIFTIGARNPWRISFDRLTGDLWVADVGQGALEEVDVLYASDGGGAGANLGWSLVEGTLPFLASSPPSDGYVDPIYEYGRSDGCSITGGYVYRGSNIPALQGSYVFGDYCSGLMWGLASSEAEGFVGRFDLGLRAGSRGLVSFGEDTEGELYVLSFDNTISRIDPA